MTSPKNLESIIRGFAPKGPAGLVDEILGAIADAGIPLDLGPMTPDVRAKFDAITAEARSALHKKFHPEG